MNQENAQKLIVIATIITLGSTVGATIRQPPKTKIDPSRIHRYIFGGFAAMFISSIIADFDARLGVGLAALVAGGAFINYGLPTILDAQLKEKESQKGKGRKGTTGESLANPPATQEPRLV